MPLGQENQSDNKPFFLRIRVQDKDKQPIVPEFSVQTKNEQGEYVELPNVKRVAGDLVSVKISKRTVKTPAGNQEVDDVKVVLEDKKNQEVYFVDARPSQLGRNLYNSLLNLTNGKEVSIALYQTKPNDEGKVYPGIALRQNNELVKGKFSREEVPAPEEVKNKKGEILQRDYSEVNSFYFEKLKDLVSSFVEEKTVVTEREANEPAPKSTKKSKKKEAAAEPDTEGEPVDEIPF